MSLANGLVASNITGCKGAILMIQAADQFNMYTNETQFSVQFEVASAKVKFIDGKGNGSFIAIG